MSLGEHWSFVDHPTFGAASERSAFIENGVAWPLAHTDRLAPKMGGQSCVSTKVTQPSRSFLRNLTRLRAARSAEHATFIGRSEQRGNVPPHEFLTFTAVHRAPR